jgi:hypothetical protein
MKSRSRFNRADWSQEEGCRGRSPRWGSGGIPQIQQFPPFSLWEKGARSDGEAIATLDEVGGDEGAV